MDSLEERVKNSFLCTMPDIDVPRIFCGHPLPCPRHPEPKKKRKGLKYRKGIRITSIGELVAMLKAGKWIYLRDRPKHPSFLLSMTLWTIIRFIDSRSLYEAEVNDDEIPKQDRSRDASGHGPEV